MNAESVDVLIAGGGIAGLSTSFELHRRGLTSVVIERAPRAGGVILSEEIDGYTIDAGPDSLLVQKPQGLELCRQLGLGDRLVPTNVPRLAYIQRNGRLHALPANSVLGIPTRPGRFSGPDCSRGPASCAWAPSGWCRHGATRATSPSGRSCGGGSAPKRPSILPSRCSRAFMPATWIVCRSVRFFHASWKRSVSTAACCVPSAVVHLASLQRPAAAKARFARCRAA